MSDNTNLPPCPACGCTVLVAIGKVRHREPLMVARVPVKTAIGDCFYVRCSQCDFHFKSPQIPEEELIRCYMQSPGDRWGIEVDPIERNFDRVESAIKKYTPGNRVLDVGCSSGSFLDYLGDQWNRFGVEPSTEASEIAESRGITIVAKEIHKVKSDARFDTIVAMDVLEHLPNPRAFIGTVAALLAPGGIFVASTGDTDSWSWRLQSEKYWYCSAFPEHVSFFNHKSIDLLGQSFSLKTVEHTHFSYKRRPLHIRLAESCKGIAFSTLTQLNWLGFSKLNGKYEKRGGTNWSSANDHMLHTMRLGT